MHIIARTLVAVQRLVAKTVDVERETALVVGSDNVLLGIRDRTNSITVQTAA